MNTNYSRYHLLENIELFSGNWIKWKSDFATQWLAQLQYVATEFLSTTSISNIYLNELDEQ